jgi:ABC-2 type transport system ATP-binding protein
MLDLIHSLSREKNITVFLSSHLLDQVQRICDRVGIMIKGELVAIGPIQELGQKKLGIDKGHYTLEEIYMKYFKEA